MQEAVKAEEEGRGWLYTQWYWTVPPSGCWPRKAKDALLRLCSCRNLMAQGHRVTWEAFAKLFFGTLMHT